MVKLYTEQDGVRQLQNGICCPYDHIVFTFLENCLSGGIYTATFSDRTPLVAWILFPDSNVPKQAKLKDLVCKRLNTNSITYIWEDEPDDPFVLFKETVFTFNSSYKNRFIYEATSNGNRIELQVCDTYKAEYKKEMTIKELGFDYLTVYDRGRILVTYEWEESCEPCYYNEPPEAFSGKIVKTSYTR